MISITKIIITWLFYSTYIIYYAVLGKRKIYNGSEVTPDFLQKVLYVVRIQNVINQNQYIQCGGSYIAAKWVLTAAHCVDIQFRKPIICIASIHAKSCPFSRTAIQTYIHPDFKSAVKLPKDIALLRLNEPFNISASNYTIHFPTLLSSRPLTADSNCIGLGWGEVSRNKSSDRLNYMNITPTFACAPYIFCTGSEHSGQCHGDSGGPLICDDTIYGVLSSVSGEPCTESTTIVAFYMHVGYFYPFIMNLLKGGDVVDVPSSTQVPNGVVICQSVDGIGISIVLAVHLIY